MQTKAEQNSFSQPPRERRTITKEKSIAQSLPSVFKEAEHKDFPTGKVTPANVLHSPACFASAAASARPTPGRAELRREGK
jgi:hypothetical protein